MFWPATTGNAIKENLSGYRSLNRRQIEQAETRKCLYTMQRHFLK
jgi:hypothetical protein